jgi:uncharacterized membrane protein
MVLAHVADSWTREADRHAQAYYALIFVAGLASPLFLCLAGLATALSAASRARRAGSHEAGARAARRRGWEILALGFVFRMQAQILGWGPLANLLRVDMLNIMGLCMVASSALWQAVPRRVHRMTWFGAVAVAVAMVTPLVRTASWPGWLPDPVEAYLRPAGAYSAFPLFPWAGFLFAGVVLGDAMDGTRGAPRVRQHLLQVGLAAAGVAGVVLGWLASFRPALYPGASFWHDSPTFFFIRLGCSVAALPATFAIARGLGPRPLQPLVLLGQSSLFVYWIHIEMVYGVIAEPLKRALPLWSALVGTALLTLVLYLVVLAKNRWLQAHPLAGRWRVLAPVVRG